MSSSDSENTFRTDTVDQEKSTPALVEKFVIRLPKGLRDQIRDLSDQNRRSMNSEIIMVLEQHIQQSVDAMRADFEDQIPHYEENYGNKDQKLSEKLQELPADKKEALLSLLT